MQDIGGVRAILDNIDQIRRVEERLKRNRPVVGYSDYITEPRASGYRGVHVVVAYGAGRPIEVQLRTHAMHEWALMVERLSSQAGANYKQDGDSLVQRFMAAVSEAMAIEEVGGQPSSELEARIRKTRAEMMAPLQGRR